MELNEKLKKNTDGNEKNEELAANVKKLWEKFRNENFETKKKKNEFDSKFPQKEKEFRRLFSEFDATKAEIKNALELKETLAEKRQNLQKLQVLYTVLQWPMAHGPWPMAHGPWPMAHGPWPMAHGPWPMAHGPWPMAHGPWPKVHGHGPWSMVHGHWSMAKGPWPKVHGPWPRIWSVNNDYNFSF